ncbi:MAG: hypothetical protein ACRD5I_09240 [Candidatus Acidiferrales bacterium]
MVAVAALALLTATAPQAADMQHTSGPFKGAKVNGGTVTHTKQNGKNVLTLSDDFQVPDTPDPHWQVVDSNGTVYQLERLDVKEGAMMQGAMTAKGMKGGKDIQFNRSITLPAYIHDVAKVQIYCAWAEALLGEASFAQPVK